MHQLIGGEARALQARRGGTGLCTRQPMQTRVEGRPSPTSSSVVRCVPAAHIQKQQ